MRTGQRLRGAMMVIAAACFVPAAMWATSPESAQNRLSPEMTLHEAQAKVHAQIAEESAGAMVEAAPSTVLSSGGPDAFGYTYIDSNEPGGPTFDWIDISSTGTQIFGSYVDDEYAYPIPIGFTFSFYGQDFTEAAVGSNGTIYFGSDAYLGLGNNCIPGATDYDVEQNFIALYWDDLHTEQGRVLFQTLGTAPNRRFVVMFDNVGFCCFVPEVPMSFEVILSEADNSILLQYLNPSTTESGRDNGGQATIGIQKDPTLGLQYSCNSPSLSAGLAIRFSPGTTYSLIFQDDVTATQVCLDPETGDFRWSIMFEDFIIASYEGTLNVYNAGVMFWSPPGAPQYVYVYYDPNNHRAWGYLYDYSTYVYSSLFDSNTLDNPEECASGVQRPPVD